MSTQDSREVLALRGLHELMTAVNSAEQVTDLLRTVVQGVVDVLGFRIAVIYVLDSEDVLEVVAVAGDDGAHDAVMGRRVPLSQLSLEFEIAEKWGALRFVPHELLPPDAVSAWVPDFEPLDVPDAWHPLDALYALLHDHSGRLLGVLGVDLPIDGMRPGLLRRQVLEMYAVQAGLAIHHAQDRARLSEQLGLGATTRSIVGAVADRLDAASILEQVVEPLVAGYRCDRLWFSSFDPVDRARPARVLSHPAEVVDLRDPELDTMVEQVARHCLEHRRALTVVAHAPGSAPRPTAGPCLDGIVERLGPGHFLVSPLASGSQLLGCIVMIRDSACPPWTQSETEAAFGLGQELGRSVLHARLYETERRLNAELHELDRYKTEFMDTITHELKAPLTVIDGHVELLEESLAPAASVQAIRRGTERLRRLVDDLLLLARVKDPRVRPQRTAVDLADVITELEDTFSLELRRRALTLCCQEVNPGVEAWGDREELARALSNVVGNAVKYTPDGGSVTLRLRREMGAAEFSCADTGIGIDASDQAQLFEEFNRSSNPEAHAIPGTGLGLAIVKRIVERHDGTISVASRRGSGSTFRIRVPAAPLPTR